MPTRSDPGLAAQGYLRAGRSLPGERNYCNKVLSKTACRKSSGVAPSFLVEGGHDKWWPVRRFSSPLPGAQNLQQSGGAPASPQGKIGDPQPKWVICSRLSTKGERGRRAETRADKSKVKIELRLEPKNRK